MVMIQIKQKIICIIMIKTVVIGLLALLALIIFGNDNAFISLSLQKQRICHTRSSAEEIGLRGPAYALETDLLQCQQ
jgi:hypothetical protein